jgi:hypothetical protein
MKKNQETTAALSIKALTVIGGFIAFFMFSTIILPLLIVPSIIIDSSTYYSTVIGINTIVISLYMFLLQRSIEQRIAHDENKRKARGIFEVKYANGSVLASQYANKRIFTDNHTEGSPTPKATWHFSIQLHGESSIYDCHVRFIAGDKLETAIVGLVVPGQQTVISVINSADKMTIVIIYRTMMGETIKHEFKFNNGIDNNAEYETMAFMLLDKKITSDNIEEVRQSNEFKELFLSESRLFPLEIKS